MTFRALTASQAQAPTISGITAAERVAGLVMLPVPILAAGRYMAVAAGGRAAERVPFRLWLTQLRAAGRHRLLEPALRLAFLAQYLHPAMQVRQATGLSAARAAAVVARLLRLPRTALRAARAGLAEAEAEAAAVAAIRVLVVRAALAALATAL